MAFNLQTFKTRTLTAAVFVVVMLLGLLWNQWSFFILFSIIHFGCWVEYQKLIGLIDRKYQEISPFHQYAIMIIGWCMMLFGTGNIYHFSGLNLHIVGFWIGLIFVIAFPLSEILFKKSFQLKNLGYSALGLLYISIPLALMVSLRSIDQVWMSKTLKFYSLGFIMPLAIIFSIWINDTMAYIVGSLIGKTPFSKISPQKTWEGTIGGAILCVAIITELAYLLGLSRADAGIISLIAAVFGTAGDLFESKLKRMASVKDSGHIMPGHGGFLDRFDSLLFASVFVWLYVQLVML
jgi:phosphatidate cytidylyltransferase